MSGTIASPSFTARLPPGVKQFCTSMTSSASLSVILILSAAKALRNAVPQRPRPPTRPLQSPENFLLVMSFIGYLLREIEMDFLRAAGLSAPLARHSLRL